MTLLGTGLLGALYYALPWIWKRTVYRHHNFILSFIEQLPTSNDSLHKLEGLLIFPLRDLELFVLLEPRMKTKIRNVGLRPLSYRLENLPKKDRPVEIVSLDYWNNRYIPIQAAPDTEGGMGADLVRSLRDNEGLYFRIKLRVAQPWVGRISFRAIDDQALPSYGRNQLVAVGLTYDEAIHRLDLL
jgi:hypothetical protein